MALRKPVNDSDHIRGNPFGKIELIEYGDFQCPYCGAAFPLVEKLMEVYGDKIKFTFRNFPLSKIHPSANLAAQAAEAAALQNKFWEMHFLLFSDQKHLLRHNIFERAENLQLDMEKFAQDMEDETITKEIEDEFYDGLRSGVNRTPTFFVNGEHYHGEPTSLEEFIKAKM